MEREGEDELQVSTPDYPQMLKVLAEQIGGPATVAPTPDEFEALKPHHVTPKQTAAALDAVIDLTKRGRDREWELRVMTLHGGDADDPVTAEDGVVQINNFRRSVEHMQLVFSVKDVKDYQFEVVTLDRVHLAWRNQCKAAEANGEDIPRHPFLPLVRAWLKRPTEVVPFTPRRRGSLPRLANVTDAEAEDAMTLPFPSSDEKQLSLPGIPEAIDGYPSWLLNAFEHLVGDIKWRYPPLSLRLFVAVLLRLCNADRDGAWHTMAFPVLQRNVKHPAGESLESMLYGEKGWTNWHSKEHQDRLLRALHELKRSAATWLTRPDNDGGFEFFNVSGFHMKKGEPFVEGIVEFSVRIPRSAAHGDRIDWAALQGYGLKSRPLYCGYLSACAVIGATAHHGHGQTAEIGKPLVGEDGKALYHKGKPKRDNTALVPNERAERLVRPHTKRDLARFCAMNPNIREDRRRAVAHFEKIDDDGYIDLRREGDMWRIFAPRNTG